jgi:hypothetical protein
MRSHDYLVLRRQDAEKDKLRSALGSAIMVETPNIKVSTVPL